MKGPRVVLAVVGGAVAMCVVFLIALLLIKALWSWTVPDLFPGAVREGLIARSITWLSAMKVALVLAVFSGLARGGGRKRA